MEKNDVNQKGVFANLGIKESLLKAVAALKISEPTPIQTQAIPPALSGSDLLGIAQTGTGKTFAFGIPMLQRLGEIKGRGLVILPTRELAQQVEKSLHSLGGSLGLRTAVLIGGESVNKQLFALRRKPHVIVATPGRLNDLLDSGSLKLDDVSVLVLDEADMMFDMGFMPQIEKIIQRVPEKRQTLLFSATMPDVVLRLAKKYLKSPVRIEVAPAGTAAELVDQEIYLLPRDGRWEQLTALLREYKESALVFVRTKHGAAKIAKKLRTEGFHAADIHSNLSFAQRQAALAGFKSGKFRVLVATDVAARGLDINGIQLVLNFDLPDNSEDYVHRIGRTARAGKPGKAVSFAAPDQGADVRKIESLIRQQLPVRSFGGAELLHSSTVKNRRGRRHGAKKELIVSAPHSSVKLKKRQKAAVSADLFIEKSSKDKEPKKARIEKYESLGFNKRRNSLNIIDTPDYLLPKRVERRHKDDRYKKTVGENKKMPPIVNPSFEGGNRYAFRRKMFLLKEEARGVVAKPSIKKKIVTKISGRDINKPAVRRFKSKS